MIRSAPNIICILLIISGLLAICCAGPVQNQTVEAGKGFYVEQYQVFVPDTHGFTKVMPVLPDSREIFLLARGDAYIWLSKLPSFLTSSSVEDRLSEIWVLVQERIYNDWYLKGTRITPANLERVEHPTRPHIEQTIIVERTPELMSTLNDFDRHLYAHEIKRFPLGEKMMMATCYTPMDDSIYALTIAAPPEDFLFWQEDAKKIFFEMKLDTPVRPQGY
jgi:hypothetical protein